MTPEEEKADSQRRVDAATNAMRDAFGAAKNTTENPAIKLAFALLEEAMTEGTTVGLARKRYTEGTDEDTRRDAAGMIWLLSLMTTKMEEVLRAESYKLKDSFIEEASPDDEEAEDYNCGNPDCPIHGTNAAKLGDVLTPDQLGMLPPEMAAGFAALIKQGLIVKHVGKQGPFGAVSLEGPKHLIAAADAIVAAAKGNGAIVSGNLVAGLPTVEQEMDTQPQDSHTKEISDALDKAFGKGRSHLPKKDIPLS
jgi:hypothetical protein